MSELISGKEAKLALAKDKEVEYFNDKYSTLGWNDANELNGYQFTAPQYKFRLKPCTITLNGIEVPKNSKKHDKDQVVWVVNTSCENWYDWIYGSDCDSTTLYWETEEEIKQVVAALRSIFK